MNALLLLAALAAAAAPRPVKLVVPLAQHRPFVQAVVGEALASRTGRAVLRRLESPVPVIIAPEPLGGYFDYDTGVLGLGPRYLKAPPAKAAPTVVHEVTHVLQKRGGVLPSDSFEMEIEAYINDFKVHRELGLKPKRGSYDWKAQRAFSKGVDELVEFLRPHYRDNFFFKDYDGHLEGREERLLARRKRLLERLRRARPVLRHLRGHEAANYRRELAGLEEKLAEVDTLLYWTRRDAAIMSDPARRKAYRDRARRVMRRARDEQKRWRR